MNELLPCPFCKAAAVLVEHDHDTAGSYWVACCASHTCPASEVIVDTPTREEAIAAWNTRAALTASTWAVTNTHTGTMVGCYTKAKAEQLRDEWNALAMKARKEQPYAIVGLAVVAS